ncbi:hypothetical protein GGE07_005897 [Sinorhizobium terangae]|nr:hypothetical protein [Sinorhizobium terangae]
MGIITQLGRCGRQIDQGVQTAVDVRRAS